METWTLYLPYKLALANKTRQKSSSGFSGSCGGDDGLGDDWCDREEELEGEEDQVARGQLVPKDKHTIPGNGGSERKREKDRGGGGRIKKGRKTIPGENKNFTVSECEEIE